MTTRFSTLYDVVNFMSIIDIAEVTTINEQVLISKLKELPDWTYSEVTLSDGRITSLLTQRQSLTLIKIINEHKIIPLLTEWDAIKMVAIDSLRKYSAQLSEGYMRVQNALTQMQNRPMTVSQNGAVMQQVPNPNIGYFTNVDHFK